MINSSSFFREDLRIDLLDNKNIYLIKSLYGLMMLLPQTKAFNILRKRLQCVPNAQFDETVTDHM